MNAPPKRVELLDKVFESTTLAVIRLRSALELTQTDVRCS